MCCGVLSETDEEGIRTDYAYDSALQLTEITRAAVYDGETCITPETIIYYLNVNCLHSYRRKNVRTACI